MLISELVFAGWVLCYFFFSVFISGCKENLVSLGYLIRSPARCDVGLQVRLHVEEFNRPIIIPQYEN